MGGHERMRHIPAGTVTSTVFFVLTLPNPEQSPHSPCFGIVVPDPRQVLQVVAIWNPLCTMNVLVPVPLHVLHTERFIPAFNPLPLQVLQSTIGMIVTVRVAPLAASKKDTVVLISMSAPRLSISGPPPNGLPPVLVPPPNAEPNRASKMSA